MISALDIHVTGIVQGVGFRPFVYRQARLNLINGWVLNSADGVHIHAEGEDGNLDAFCLSLANDAPPAANVEQVEMREVPLQNFTNFEIRFSTDDTVQDTSHSSRSKKTLVSADVATCKDCLNELFDPADRRYRYPFINCTNCGPRFTIISRLPYDRCNTSMQAFEMCADCAGEYESPTDRRFHAQPNACFECGPYVTWKLAGSTDIDFGNTRQASDEIFASAVALLRDGGILAVKGLGGYHLACDASNSQAVDRLRKNKQRSNKAFAVMANSLADVRRVANVNSVEEQLLTGAQRPIVLLKKAEWEADYVAYDALPYGNGVGPAEDIKGATAENAFGGYSQVFRGGSPKNDNGGFSEIIDGTTPKYDNSSTSDVAYDEMTASRLLSPHVTMGLPEVGVMLPYTPVQHLLMHDFVQVGGIFLVMTSGNIYDNPICISDDEAYELLDGVADAFLGNNREILSRFDDSVVRVLDLNGGSGSGGSEDKNAQENYAVQMIRRARGYAPVPIKLKCGGNKFLQSRECGDSDSSVEENVKNQAQDDIVFAAGPEQKNTMTFLRFSSSGQSASQQSDCSAQPSYAEAFVSQHIGDLENAEVMDAWNSARERMQTLFDLQPNRFAYDMHPDYLSTKWVQEKLKEQTQGSDEAHSAATNANSPSISEQRHIDSANSPAIPAQRHVNQVANPLAIPVQHHFAHIASVMAENELPGPVAGFAFDGTGYGADKNIWGGEVLLCNNHDYERFANFCYVPMPGVSACVKNPTQMAAGVLWAFELTEHPFVSRLASKGRFANLNNLYKIIESGTNVAYTSSIGRLFDAASALSGVCCSPTYEGEAAIMFEAEMYKLAGWKAAANAANAANATNATNATNAKYDGNFAKAERASNNKNLQYNPDPRYTIKITKNSATENSTAHDTSVVLLDPSSTFKAILDDLERSMSVTQISLNFHNAFVEAIITTSQLIAQMYGINTVALSGGCFMNRYLMETSIVQLAAAGFNVAINREVPCNDGGISLGQAAIAIA